MKLALAASSSCLLSLPTAMASTKATKAKASPNKIKESSNKIVTSQYALGPVNCPGTCASGANIGGILVAENVQQCDPEDKDQVLLVHENGGLIKLEIRTNLGRCLGVAADGGDMLTLYKSSPSSNEDTCNGRLALVDCQDPTANWMFTRGQLFCWIEGHSAVMTVNEDCTSLELSLAADGAPESITRAEMFMLLEPSFIPTPRPTPPPTPPPTFIVTFGSTPTVSTETTVAPTKNGGSLVSDNALSSPWQTLFWVPCNKGNTFNWNLDQGTVNEFNSAAGMIANTIPKDGDDCSEWGGFGTSGRQASSYLDAWVENGGSWNTFELWMRPRDDQQLTTPLTESDIDYFYNCLKQTWPTSAKYPPPQTVTGVLCILDKNSANTCRFSPPANYKYAIMDGPYVMREVSPSYPEISADFRLGEMYEPCFMPKSCDCGSAADQSEETASWLDEKSGGDKWGSWGVPTIGNGGADCKTPYSNLPEMVTQLKADFAKYSALSNLKNLGLYC